MFSAALGNNLKSATTYEVLRAASVEKPDIYIHDEKVTSDNVAGVMKAIVCCAVEKAPGIGSLFSGLLGAFWPDGSNDIWESMKNKVEAMIDEKIDENNAKQHGDRLQGLYLVLRNFEKQPPQLQAQRFPALLNIILHDAPAFLNDKSPWRSLPHVVFFGTLYLSALWTQWKYCKLIDGTEKNEAYEKDLIAAVNTLQAVVAKGKEASIARRKDHIKVNTQQSSGVGAATSYGIVYSSGPSVITHEVEDPQTNIKLTISGDRWSAEGDKNKLLKQLHHEIDSKYGAELDTILAPTRLWSLYLPHNGVILEPHQYLEFPGWVWNGITSRCEWFDLSEYPRTFGNITRIDYHHGKDYYGTKQVFGVEIFFGSHAVLLGAKRGEPVSFELKAGEVITSARATGNTVLETIGFAKAAQTTDKQGRTSWGESSQTSNVDAMEGFLSSLQHQFDVAKHPEMSSAHAEMWHTGKYFQPHPTHMIYACGWHVNDPKEGYIALFQPVFGCKETIEPNGTTTWS